MERARDNRNRLRRAADAGLALLPSGSMLPDHEWHRRQRVLVLVLALNAVALVLVALASGYGPLHSLAEGLIVGVFMLPSVFGNPERRWARGIRSGSVALGLLTASALLVHITGGLIEAHFHFFVILALIAMYEDWKIFVLYFSYVLLHHGVVGTIAPHAVFNHDAAILSPWTWAVVHAIAVAGAAIGSLVCWRFNEDLRRAQQTAYESLRDSQEQLRQANEELRELDDLKTEFVSMASHELRTPMTSITAFSTLMSSYWDELDDEVRRRHTGTIASQARRLERLVNSLLHMSAIESGSWETAPTELDVDELVHETVREVGADVQVDCEPGLTAYADRDQLQQVLVNFLGNAVKYGAAPIEVVARLHPLHADRLELVVSDQGPGVPEQFVPRLFERFSQASSGERRMSKGTGLGLAIVEALVTANSGIVRYEPNDPVGARFVVELPATMAGAEPRRREAASLVPES